MSDEDGGFTLIEAVIAVMVISIAVITLMGGLTAMINLTQHHRGHAVAETAARSFGQAVQATAQSSAVLAAGVSAATTQITVTDATTLPRPGANTFLLLGRELVRLTNVDRATGVLTVARGQGGTTATAHAVSAGVATRLVPHLRCPSASDLTPDPGSFVVSPGASLVITDVQFIDPTSGAFVSTSSGACLADYRKGPCAGSTLLPECGTGLFRVLISVTTTADNRLKGVEATTQVLVRSGST